MLHSKITLQEESFGIIGADAFGGIDAAARYKIWFKTLGELEGGEAAAAVAAERHFQGEGGNSL